MPNVKLSKKETNLIEFLGGASEVMEHASHTQLALFVLGFNDRERAILKKFAEAKHEMWKKL